MIAISTRDRISEELDPYFKYATDENPSKALHTFTSSDGNLKCHLVYQNCVACNSERFALEELYRPRIGTDTYMCPECASDVINKFKKYTHIGPDSSAEEREVFSELWNNHLYSRMPSA